MAKVNQKAYDALQAMPMEDIPGAKIMIRVNNKTITGHGLMPGSISVIIRRNRESAEKYEVQGQTGRWWVHVDEFTLLPADVAAVEELITIQEFKMRRLLDFKKLLELNPGINLGQEGWKAPLIVELAEKMMPVDERREKIVELLMLTQEDMFDVLT